MDRSNEHDDEWAPRLEAEELAKNFDDVRPPLSAEEALVEAQRCYYCPFDTPCTRGCPTHIDIPTFIRQIAEGDPKAAARTILQANVFGAVCARVCPVEKLCEQLCICQTTHGRPIPIGKLQRFATDQLLASGELPFQRLASTGRRVAIVGAGPAGIAAAFELARLGHGPVVFEKDQEPGGLDRYGIAEYKINAAFVRKELGYLLSIGGIDLHVNQPPVDAAELRHLLASHDAVLLAIGLGPTRQLGIPGEDLAGSEDALQFIRAIKTQPLASVRVGTNVVVVGAGNTAVDAATQAKRLGAASVTLVYRRDRRFAKCTDHEYELSLSDGCSWVWNVRPVEVLGEGGRVVAVRLQSTEGEPFEMPCDHFIKATGQEAHGWLRDVDGLELMPNGTLKVDPLTYMTSRPGVFAAGDCVLRAKEVVNAVREGKSAALAIDGRLMNGRPRFL
jgi:glutamate synthase (NADPH/NADH) small chain